MMRPRDGKSELAVQLKLTSTLAERSSRGAVDYPIQLNETRRLFSPPITARTSSEGSQPRHLQTCASVAL